MQGGMSLHVSLQVEFDFVDTEGGPGAEMLLVRAEYVGIDMDSMTKFKDKEVCDILPVCVSVGAFILSLVSTCWALQSRYCPAWSSGGRHTDH